MTQQTPKPKQQPEPTPEDPTDGVGRQSGQQREHGHMSREDQQRDTSGGGGTDRLSGHPDASRESVQRGTPGGTGDKDSGRA